MSLLRNLSVSRKFTLAFGLVCVLCTMLGALTILAFHSVTTKAADVRNNALPSIAALGAVEASFNATRQYALALLLCPAPECKAVKLQALTKAMADYNQAVNAYAPMVHYPGEQEIYQDFKKAAEQSNAISLKMIADVDSNNLSDAMDLIMADGTVRTYESAVNGITRDRELNTRFGTASATEAVQTASRSTGITIAVSAIVLLLCVATGLMLTRLIAPPLAAVTQALEQLAEKDLTASVDEVGTDEVGRLSAALNRSVSSMRSVIESVAHGVSTLSSAAEELSVRSTETSGNTHAQSDKTNQIAAAAQEMTATIGEISQNAEAAARASRQSAEKANEGGVVMQSAAETMQRISSASTSVSGKMTELATRSVEIGKVVTVIQDISEQTNLLALNAAIEAARAGEHGRGFAVVAGEVRRLAERTRSATQEISATIESIQEETRQTLDLMHGSQVAVENGIDETSRARNSLEAIIASAREVEHMIHLIATAATEQTGAAGEISESASQISQLATENSHASEETAEGCKQLTVLANDLDGVIRQFRLEEEKQPGGRWKGSTKSVAGATAYRAV
uniref:Putative bacterial chemotaxis sensory transducer n=1 Tax=mine drainage metagenome TaxID=410659 RepID=E6QKU0_9ZZZZ